MWGDKIPTWDVPVRLSGNGLNRGILAGFGLRVPGLGFGDQRLGFRAEGS